MSNLFAYHILLVREKCYPIRSFYFVNFNLQDVSVLIFQETCTDAFESLVIYAAVDRAAMDVVISGGDSSYLPFLPLGFVIVPDLSRDSNELNNDESGNGGSLLTIGFHILANLMTKSIEAVKTLMTRTLHGIKASIDQCCAGQLVTTIVNLELLFYIKL